MGDSPFFTHFIVGALLVLVLVVIGLLGFIVVGLWQSGLTTFIIVAVSLWVFGWVVHQLAKSETIRDWINDL